MSSDKVAELVMDIGGQKTAFQHPQKMRVLVFALWLAENERFTPTVLTR